MFYSTLDRVKTYLEMSDTEVADDNELLEMIARSTRAIDRYTRRTYAPKWTTTWYCIPWDNRELRVDFDLLEVRGLSDRAGTRAFGIEDADIQLRTGMDWNLYPKNTIAINPDSGSAFNYTGVTPKQVKLEAIEGYHEDYENAWVDTAGITLASAASNASLVYLSASDGVNSWYIAPRYSVGNLLRLEDEYMWVVGFQSASEAIVKRAALGTTAASHASGLSLDVWEVEDDIEFATTRLTGFVYTQKKNPFGNRLVAPQFGTIEIPEKWPIDVQQKLEQYIRDRTLSRLI